MQPAVHPHNQRILHILNYCPYIMLPTVMDADVCFAEATALLNRFVPHRNYSKTDTDHKWKSLCLKGLNGEATRTLYHTDYGVTEPQFSLTEVAELCPKTIEFLKTVTDLDNCGRVRFMLLEPGGRIHVHRDNAAGHTTIGINIAINNPEGCDFHIEVDKDGLHSKWTRKIPFKPGLMALIDVGRFHYVENNSNEPRIHMIIDGPIRFSPQQIIEFAKNQNKLHSDKDLSNLLLLKKADQGYERKDVRPFLDFVKTQGIDRETFKMELEIIVVEPDVDAELKSEMLRMTSACLYPLYFTVTNRQNLDFIIHQTMGRSVAKAALILTAGMYFEVISEFLHEVFKSLQQLRKQNSFLMGHILFDKDRPDRVDLHRQMVLINFNAIDYKQLGHVNPPENCKIDFPQLSVSDFNYHDTYTPAWLDQGEMKIPPVEAGWGTLLMAQSIERKQKILNFDHENRTVRQYSYPEKGIGEELKKNRTAIQAKLKAATQKIYLMNNEPLSIVQISGFRPVIMISVAAGFKPSKILQQYWHGRAAEKIVLYDYSSSALSYIKQLSKCETATELVLVIMSYIRKEKMFMSMNENDFRIIIQQMISLFFANNNQHFYDNLNKIKIAEFNNLDIVNNYESIFVKFDGRAPFVFWHSNVWSNDLLSFLHSPTQIEQMYSQFIIGIAQKYNVKAWKHIHNKEIILGDDFKNIKGIITDGVNQKHETNLNDYRLYYDPSAQLNTSNTLMRANLLE